MEKKCIIDSDSIRYLIELSEKNRKIELWACDLSKWEKKGYHALRFAFRIGFSLYEITLKMIVVANEELQTIQITKKKGIYSLIKGTDYYTFDGEKKGANWQRISTLYPPISFQIYQDCLISHNLLLKNDQNRMSIINDIAIRVASLHLDYIFQILPFYRIKLCKSEHELSSEHELWPYHFSGPTETNIHCRNEVEVHDELEEMIYFHRSKREIRSLPSKVHKYGEEKTDN